MSPARPVTIVGGGLAGLSLGLALRRLDLDVDLHEAGTYPRHRVCGEFIAGLDAWTRSRLGLDPFLADALRHEEVAWHHRDRLVRRQILPEPALALSRQVLDARLARAFRAAGGRLHERSRITAPGHAEGWVFAHGRRRGRSGWLGLKVHVRNLPLAAGLELHLGDGAYVGLCALPGGEVNVSGLFLQRPGLTPVRGDVLGAYLHAAGLGRLARRLADAETDPDSRCAVAGLGFTPAGATPGQLALGDAWAMIPPFTGNGMAMAFQSAALATPALAAWARRTSSWSQTTADVHRALNRHFRLRLNAARALHAWLLRPARQRWLAWAARAGLLPLRPLYHTLH